MKQTALFPLGNFRNLFFCLIVLVIVGNSCQKDKDNDKFFVTCKVDGVKMEFNKYTFAHKEEAGADISVTITGTTGQTNDAAYVGFVVINYPGSLPIGARSYSDTDAEFEILASYSTDASGTGYDAGTTVAYEAVSESVTIANHFSANITELTGKIARGTFSGDFYLDGDVHGQKLTISEGEFYVEFK